MSSIATKRRMVPSLPRRSSARWLSRLLCASRVASTRLQNRQAALSRGKPAALAVREARSMRVIAKLKKESLEDSLARLCLFSPEGFPVGGHEEVITIAFPLRSQHGTDDIYGLMRSRRLLKIYVELAALPKPKASVLVQRHLEVALKEYNRMYDELFPLDGPAGKGWGQISDDGNVEHATFLGRRTQVLGLVFLAGNLQLKELDADVLQVVQRGVKQYDDMRNSTKYDKPTAVLAVAWASLYSPETLATGLIGTATRDDDPVLTKYRSRLDRAKRAPFTQVDGLFGPVPTTDAIELRYFENITEADLEQLIAAVAPR